MVNTRTIIWDEEADIPNKRERLITTKAIRRKSITFELLNDQ